MVILEGVTILPKSPRQTILPKKDTSSKPKHMILRWPVNCFRNYLGLKLGRVIDPIMEEDNMKKSLLAILLSCTLLFSLTACLGSQKDTTQDTSDNKQTNPAVTAESETDESLDNKTEPSKAEDKQAKLQTPAKLLALKGPTAMGLAKYKADLDKSQDPANLTYEIVTMPDQVATGLIKGEVDLACVPANLAATVYNKSQGKVQVAAINVLNVLYLAGNNTELKSLTDLKGKTLYTTGQGATPEAILTSLFKEAGLVIGQDIEVQYFPEASEVAAKLQAEDGAIALLPQPFLTAASLKNDQIKSLFSMADLWAEYMGQDKSIVTGVLLVQKDFAQENEAWLKQFLDAYQTSVQWVKANPQEAGELIEQQGIIGAPVATKAIPHCGLSLVRGQDMVDKLNPYLQTLAEVNPALLGGSVPDQAFYYLGNESSK